MNLTGERRGLLSWSRSPMSTSSTPLGYGPPEIFKLDIAVLFSVEELRMMINVLGENSDGASVYLEALWKKEGADTKYTTIHNENNNNKKWVKKI